VGGAKSKNTILSVFRVPFGPGHSQEASDSTGGGGSTYIGRPRWLVCHVVLWSADSPNYTDRRSEYRLGKIDSLRSGCYVRECGRVGLGSGTGFGLGSVLGLGSGFRLGSGWSSWVWRLPSWTDGRRQYILL